MHHMDSRVPLSLRLEMNPLEVSLAENEQGIMHLCKQTSRRAYQDMEMVRKLLASVNKQTHTRQGTHC